MWVNAAGCAIGILVCTFTADPDYYALNFVGLVALGANCFSAGYDARDGERDENDR